jgi:hypothetical protein
MERNTMKGISKTGILVVLAVASAYPVSALAYIGPGAGLSIFGSILAFLAAIVVAIFGFLFFPIRRLLRRRKQKASRVSPPPEPDQPDSIPASKREERPSRESGA